MANDELGPWEPFSPQQIGALFADYPGIWCIGGGWALDLFAGMQSREHDDIDIVVTRPDLPLLHRRLPGWELVAAHGFLTPWAAGEPLPADANDIWCRQGNGPWRFQMMVIPVDQANAEWVFRRDDRIRGPLATLTVDRGGLPVLAPEIQLLFKSRLPNRPKDEADFATVAPLLDAGRREWLAGALRLLYGSHPWLATLEA